jgi:hypothetical protein
MLRANGTFGIRTVGMPGRYDAGGYHGPAVVNHYYRGGCWNCTGRGGEAAAASAVGLAAGATIGAPVALPYYPVGTWSLRSPPTVTTNWSTAQLLRLRCDLAQALSANGLYYWVAPVS